MTAKPRVFIASSREGLEHAEAVFSCLERVTEPSVWTHDLFRPSSTIIVRVSKELWTHMTLVWLFLPPMTRTRCAESNQPSRETTRYLSWECS